MIIHDFFHSEPYLVKQTGKDSHTHTKKKKVEKGDYLALDILQRVPELVQAQYSGNSGEINSADMTASSLSSSVVSLEYKSSRANRQKRELLQIVQGITLHFTV